jgi:hypothetical protein
MTLSFVVQTPTSLLTFSGNCKALAGLCDKDILVSTLESCTDDTSRFIPPSFLIPYDATSLPEMPSFPAVLKMPLGSCGEGVFFVSSIAEVQEIVANNYQRAVAEKGLLQSLLSINGYIPSLVLQAEIKTKVLSCSRKFSLRSYMLLVVDDNEEEYSMHLYDKVEVRLASKSMDNSLDVRDRQAHITNGAGGSDTTRCLLEDVPELVKEHGKIMAFMRSLFVDCLDKDIRSRILASREEGRQANARVGERAFAFAGVDLMIDELSNVKCLEINVNPAAPPKGVASEDFEAHLVRLAKQVYHTARGAEQEEGDGKFGCVFSHSEDAPKQ